MCLQSHVVPCQVEWEVVSISESEGSKDKVEVCVKCEGVELGGDHRRL